MGNMLLTPDEEDALERIKQTLERLEHLGDRLEARIVQVDSIQKDKPGV